MNQTITHGGCLCGAVRYKATGRPHEVSHCHCADCRHASGAAFVTWASFAPADFRFTAGEATTVMWAGGRRSFCPRCGTPLTFSAGPQADELDVTVGSLDHPEAVAPENHTWVEDRMPWVRLADGLPTYERERTDRAADPAAVPAINLPPPPGSRLRPSVGAHPAADRTLGPSAIRVVAFAPEDPGPLVELVGAQLREHDINTDPDVLRSVLVTLAAGPEHGFLLTAACGELTVGFAYAARVLSLEHGGWSGWLEELYVRPDCRGRGVGSRLLAAVITAAAGRGWPALDLEVGIGHERAVSLYRRHHFQAAHRTRYVRSL